MASLAIAGAAVFGAEKEEEFAPPYKVLGNVTGDFEFKSDVTNAIWVSATRGFNAGSCGYLRAPYSKTTVADKFTIPDKAWVRWKFEEEKEFRTNTVDVSALPKGNQKGVVSITLTTNLAWKASFRAKAR